MRILHISDLHIGISKNKKAKGIEYDEDIYIEKSIQENPELLEIERKRIIVKEIAIFNRTIQKLHKKKKN